MNSLLSLCTINICRQAEADVEAHKGGVLYLVSLDWAIFHVEIPDFHGQIVSGHDIPPTVAELHIRN